MEPLLPPPLPILLRLGMDPERIRLVKPRSRRTHCRAVVNWLMQYAPSSEVNNLEQVKGYLEAFYHLCEINEQERAASLISVPVNTAVAD